MKFRTQPTALFYKQFFFAKMFFPDLKNVSRETKLTGKYKFHVKHLLLRGRILYFK